MQQQRHHRSGDADDPTHNGNLSNHVASDDLTDNECPVDLDRDLNDDDTDNDRTAPPLD